MNTSAHLYGQSILFLCDDCQIVQLPLHTVWYVCTSMNSTLHLMRVIQDVSRLLHSYTVLLIVITAICVFIQGNRRSERWYNCLKDAQLMGVGPGRSPGWARPWVYVKHLVMRVGLSNSHWYIGEQGWGWNPEGCVSKHAITEHTGCF